jgi:alpha-tubulin suppressor-like RCC1 family protein
MSDTTVKCWGRSVEGQLGNGTTTSSSTPVDVAGLSGVVQIAAGRFATCARLDDGTVKCWGWNNKNELDVSAFPIATTPKPIQMGTFPEHMTDLSMGGYDTCARMDDGRAYCWGDNRYLQTGSGFITGDDIASGYVMDLADVTQVATGRYHSCAVIEDGSVKCWGANNYGQLGNTTSPTTDTPQLVAGVTATQIASGANHSCALTGPVVRCWGSDEYGQLIDLSQPTDPVQVVAGDNHTCSRSAAGAVQCWGGNYGGQLGNDSTTPSTDPVDVAGISGATQISAGAAVNCALMPGGTVKCWGSNTDGQVGDGTTVDRTTPVGVVGLS